MHGERSSGRARPSAHETRRRRPQSGSETLWAQFESRAGTASRCGAVLSVGFLLSVAAYGSVLGGHFARWHALSEAHVEAALVAGGFGISEVVVNGRVQVPRAYIDEALSASGARTIFGFDTRAARARLERIGWVASARVMRLWPSTLVVELQEREAFARWEIRGNAVLIDRSGELLGPVTPAFSGLPRVGGEGADTAAAALVDRLAAHPWLTGRVSLAERVERRRWNLVLANGPRILLPANGVESALGLVERLLRAGVPGDIAVVDMRVAGRIALRREAPEGKTPGPTARLTQPPRRVRAQPL